MRAYSNRAAADLAKAARSHRLRSHFRILEGVPSPEALGLGERDFVILCGSARPFMHFSAQSSHWEEFAKRLVQGRLLLRGGMRQPGAVIAIVDEQPRAEEEIARDIAATISTGPGPDHPIVLIQLNELDRELSRRSCGLLISGRAAESSSALIEKTKVAPPIDLMLL